MNAKPLLITLVDGNSRHSLSGASMVCFLLLLSSCATYYQKNYDFNSAFEKGQLENALKTLEGKESLATGKSRFIYFANRGLLLSILGRYEESNEFLEKAFLFGEDYHLNYVFEAASYFYNPTVVVYRGEDHEHLMVLYFKALNYLKLKQPEQALVECRRLNIRLNQLSDKYSSEKKFQRDAFIHNLMGIIYQSSGDYNNAFIAYRNAVEIYETDYLNLFDFSIPDQLKKDLLNTAHWTGFTEEFDSFKTKFNMPEYQAATPGTELVFFWHNGLAPVKAEWNINFVLDKNSENMVVFTNNDLGIAFPFKVDETKEKSDLRSIELLRVAFPKYQERKAHFQSAKIAKDSMTYDLQLGEDINKIAFHSLRQRMMLEFSKGLLRAALKKATEQSVKKEDDRLGALIGVMNAMTEKADTRNWQTLPHSIYYSRVPLEEGVNEITFTTHVGDQVTKHNFTYEAPKNQTLFHTFSSLESAVPSRLY
jgi:uncharacterized protein